ncbi:hypothetical protein Tco_0264358 [Tanacetum coccineum]
MLLYSWDGGLDVCVDLTGSSPLTQTGMVDFVPGRAVIDAAQRKRGKYMANVASMDMVLSPFPSRLGELEAAPVTLLKRSETSMAASDAAMYSDSVADIAVVTLIGVLPITLGAIQTKKHNPVET